MAEIGSMGDLLGISQDGKTIVRFSRLKITDIPKPDFKSFFVAETGVFVLATSATPTGEVTRYRKPNGEIVSQPAFSVQYYVARFRLDGTYVGATDLDLPFTPLQIGVFPGDEFLVAGRAKDGSYAPRVALVKSSGQLDRLLTLTGDIHGVTSQSQADDTGLPKYAKSYEKTLNGAEAASVIVADGRNLLLVRTGQKTPVFSISAGGEIKAITPDIPPGFTVFDLYAAKNLWIGLYTKPRTDDPKDASVLVQTYALDPATGKALARYTYPQFMGFGFACSDGFEFTLLERPKDRLQLVKLVPAHRSSSQKRP
ncbi:MAG: hypothetical protein ACRD4F_11150 [Candidatus Angelobacter sp.]